MPPPSPAIKDLPAEIQKSVLPADKQNNKKEVNAAVYEQIIVHQRTHC